MKLKAIAVIVKTDDNKVYQAYIRKEHEGFITNLLMQLSKSGNIELIGKPIEHVDIILNSDE